ncbi:anaerobic ribonucleoside-triphosphate reductase activating protein [bacterium]|nr:anaerobic ribonucleoside-triphosphate reductase activating protein [bacterium]
MNNQLTPTKPIDIKGFIEVSFIDWDGFISAVIFLPRCNFHCPFCQNWQLVCEPEKIKDVDWEVIASYLKKQRQWIDGVVITGGEPTIYPHLNLLLQEIRRLKKKTKLDTNGYNPAILRELVEAKLIDYIAMDIKAPFDERYELASGIKGLNLDRLRESVEFLLGNRVEHEFRTTLVPSLITDKEIEAIGQTIKGAQRWILQDYQPEAAMDEEFRKLQPYTREVVERFLVNARKYVNFVNYRGKWR